MSKTIAIIGCGWLGLPLAVSLIEDGYEINGSSTSENKIISLKEENINPYLISLSENGMQGNIVDFLTNVDALIINIPPKLRGVHHENYVKKIALLHTEVKKTLVKKVIFVSSTSVYGEIDGEVTEKTAPRPSTEAGSQLLRSENIFRNDPELYTTIVRFGGLIGPDRHPVTMLSGKKQLKNGSHPINLIHLDDCIAILKSVILHNWWSETLNAVYPLHPQKNKYYGNEAIKRGIEIPDYASKSDKKGKKVVSEVLLNVKMYQFKTSIVS